MNTTLQQDMERGAKERQERYSAAIKRMPKLTIDKAEEYLHWLASDGHVLGSEEAQRHMTLAELLVRLRMGKAQDKATQHTLVEDGVIDPPPTAS